MHEKFCVPMLRRLEANRPLKSKYVYYSISQPPIYTNPFDIIHHLCDHDPVRAGFWMTLYRNS